MLSTPLGRITVRLDGVPIPYELVPRAPDRLCPDVKGRFLLRVPLLPDGRPHLLSCRIEGHRPSARDDINSGERLELKSFYKGDTKLSLGMEGESGCATYDYENGYLTDGVQYELLPSTKTAKYTFGVAWISPCTDKNEIQTWFGADPTL